MVEKKQHHGRVAAAAAQSRPGRNIFPDPDVESPVQAVVFADQPESAGDHIALVPADSRVGSGQRNILLLVFPQLQFIAESDRLENGAQQMIAVVPFPGYLQT
ncbi:MAG: hypothetical protein NTZ12_05160 [Candidatus Aminicenantes bacterium]|nr:hypothetical protein [Candidatus Aminicenantes bacterium]